MAVTVWKEDGHDQISAGAIDCEGSCNTDFSDIRFVDSDHSTVLPHWIEETGTSRGDHYACMWVNLDTDTVLVSGEQRN